MYKYNETQDSLYLWSHEACSSFYLPPEVELKPTWGRNFKNIVSTDAIVHLIDVANIVIYVYFDCGIIFYPDAPT